MIPSPWEGAVLALGAYRLTRLAGWDEFPLALKVRRWVIGERWVAYTPHEEVELPAGVEKAEGTGRVDAAELGLAGKQPSSEVAEVRPAYDRPMLAHLVHCPFCIGAWLSFGCYGLWLWQPYWTLVVLFPWALSGAVGLIAKQLDP